MTSQYRHRRSSNPATAFPTPIEPGEIAVNTANRQIAAGNVADGAPLDLIAVRFFDTHAIYKINDLVDFNGNLYRAAVANGPGAFNGANWTANGTQVFFGDTAPPTALDGSFFWETDSGILFVRYNDGNSSQWVIASPQPDPTTFVLRAGDTMGGPLTLAGDPTTPMMAATRQYVDAGDVASTAVATGKVSKIGDTMSGALKVPVKGNVMGVPGGVGAPLWNAAQTQAEANLLLYDNTGNNWAGFGIDNSGDVWLRLGTSGTPVPAFAVTTDQIAHFAQPPLAPTPAAADSSTKAATTAFVANAMLAAAPLDALAYNGIQFNGSFEVSQERTVGTAFTANGYLCDGWGVGSITSAASAVLVPFASSGLGNVLQLNVTTADAAMGAGSASNVYNFIEGYRTRRLAFGGASAQPVTVAFWSAHHRPGLYSVSLRNGATNRSCVMTYTHVTADAYQYNVVTFPGCQDGAWDTTNGLGLLLGFANAVGSTYTAPAAGTWYSANYFAAPGQVNGAAATTDVFRIANVIMLPGIAAPSAARSPLITRPYDQELLLARRYWWCSNPGNPKGITVGTLAAYSYAANSLGFQSWRFTVPMRIVPVVTCWNNGVLGQSRNSTNGTLYAMGAVNNTWVGPEGFSIIGVGSMATGLWVDVDMQADARF